MTTPGPMFPAPEQGRRQVLMVAFHFPPYDQGTGYLRTLKFAEHLPDSGWDPTVLTVHPRVYLQGVGDAEVDKILAMPVERAFALDTRAHLSIRSHYPQILALPDRWCTWVPFALWRGLRIIRRRRPDVLFSTFPIPSAHLIGLLLHRLTAIPWVADFRDPMLQDPDPVLKFQRRMVERLEAAILRWCTRSVFTTSGARRDYAARFPGTPESRLSVIPNGFDEDSFAAFSTSDPVPPPALPPVRIVHSGLLYPDLRDPRAVYQALGQLRRTGELTPARFQLILRASSFESYHRGLIEEHGIGDIVTLAPGVSRAEALAEMAAASGLLILQASLANRQVPAKLYEYIRVGRPVLALTDLAGDTAEAMREAGLAHVAQIDSVESVRNGIMRFMDAIEGGECEQGGAAASPDIVERYSRRGRAAELARLLDEICAEAT